MNLAELHSSVVCLHGLEFGGSALSDGLRRSIAFPLSGRLRRTIALAARNERLGLLRGAGQSFPRSSALSASSRSRSASRSTGFWIIRVAQFHRIKFDFCARVGPFRGNLRAGFKGAQGAFTQMISTTTVSTDPVGSRRHCALAACSHRRPGRRCYDVGPAARQPDRTGSGQFQGRQHRLSETHWVTAWIAATTSSDRLPAAELLARALCQRPTGISNRNFFNLVGSARGPSSSPSRSPRRDRHTLCLRSHGHPARRASPRWR